MYFGDWVENKICGLGIYQWTDGRRYEGEWNDNNMEGFGLYHWADGRVYQGQYLNDKKHGFGVYMWTDGRQYDGYWHKGKQHGLSLVEPPGPHEQSGVPPADFGHERMRRRHSDRLHRREPVIESAEHVTGTHEGESKIGPGRCAVELSDGGRGDPDRITPSHRDPDPEKRGRRGVRGGPVERTKHEIRLDGTAGVEQCGHAVQRRSVEVGGRKRRGGRIGIGRGGGHTGIVGDSGGWRRKIAFGTPKARSREQE